MSSARRTPFSAVLIICIAAFGTQAFGAETKKVTVENTPGVTVENVPGVTVENQSLSVHDLDNPALQPLQASVGIHLLFGASKEQAILATVPADKQLVIETVLARCFKGTATASHRISIETTGGGDTVEFHILPAGIGVYGRYDPGNAFEGTTATTTMNFGGALRLYADPGTDVAATARRNITTGDTSCSISIAGHLVDL
jgi:hypothetical protein